MNLIDALKTIEAHMRQGMTIECWMLSNAQAQGSLLSHDEPMQVAQAGFL